jgi:coenzyme F420-dependent glucose-6-phosphate dehydrogenase
MNEVPLGFDWPSADIRLARTTEAIQIIKNLWDTGRRGRRSSTNNNDDNNNDSGFVDFGGQYFKVRDAKLYTPPTGKIPLYMAAVGEQATKTAAKYTDGLITLTKPDQSKEIFENEQKVHVA